VNQPPWLCHHSKCFQWTCSRACCRTSWLSSWLTVRPEGTNSRWSMLSVKKDQRACSLCLTKLALQTWWGWGFPLKGIVLWFLRFYCKLWFHLMLWPLTKIFVVSEFIQYFPAYKHTSQLLLSVSNCSPSFVNICCKFKPSLRSR
jgi:hypothetical protein